MRALLSALILALLFIQLGSSPALQAQVGTPRFVSQSAVGVINSKYPALAGGGAAVHLAANGDRADALYGSRAADADRFGTLERVGLAEDQPDYSTASVAVAPDGAVVYSWVNQPQSTIFLRVKTAQGWGPTRTVRRGENFAVHPTVAVASDGAITVVWRNPDRPYRYTRSLDGGTTWSGTTTLSASAGVTVPALAAGPNGQLAVAYTGGERNKLQVYVATWNGRTFDPPTRLSSFGSDYADPSASYTPDGRLFVAWRGITANGTASGVFFAERQANGAFPVARLIGGAVEGRVSLIADAASNLHVLWLASASGSFQLWYANKPAAGSWSSPVAAPGAGGVPFNAFAAVAATPQGAVFAHAVSEVFLGTTVSLRSYRFASGLTLASAPSARPVLAQDAPRARDATLSLSLADLAGSPSEVRYRWDAAPTDSDPWLPISTTSSVPAPPLQAACVPHALFTQVRGATGMQTTALSDTIVLDTGMQVTVRSAHAHAAPGYTNAPLLEALIEDAGECSGLATASTGEVAQPAAVTTLPYLLTAPLPDAEGRYERAVTLADQLGNSSVITVGVTYDRTPPTATYPLTLTVVPDADATIFQTVQLRGASYADDSSPEALPWAVAVVVSRAPITLAGEPVVWTILPLDPALVERSLASGAPTTSADASINLAELLPRDQRSPGVYHYALALVDRAGNRTEALASGSLSLDAVTYPTISLPLLRR